MAAIFKMTGHDSVTFPASAHLKKLPQLRNV